MPAANNSIFLLSIILWSALSFLVTLFLPSVGEEGVYTNITLEMLHNNDYLVPTLYGTHYSRPPLFNWLILMVTKLLDPTQVVLAARLVNMSATLATTGLLIWFARYKFPAKNFALLAAAIYLSGDLLFLRGWLAYADSLFALCIFSAIICLWLALDHKQQWWFVGAAISLCCSFLAKVHTGYIFYALSGLVLLYYHPNRKFLFKPVSWLLHLAAVSFPFCWTIYINHGYGGVSTTWLHSQIFFQWQGVFAYLYHLVIGYPLTVFIRFLPTSIIAVYMCRRVKSVDITIKIAFWLMLLNLLPYWLVPVSNIRYILPLYPFITLLITYVIWQAGDAARQLAINCLLATVIVKYVFCIYWLPYEHKVLRGDAVAVAEDILQRLGDNNLYMNDSSSAGLRVAIELNKRRYPAAPLVMPSGDFSGYTLSGIKDLNLGTLVYEYKLRNHTLYLSFKTGPT